MIYYYDMNYSIECIDIHIMSNGVIFTMSDGTQIKCIIYDTSQLLIGTSNLYPLPKVKWESLSVVHSYHLTRTTLVFSLSLDEEYPTKVFFINQTREKLLFKIFENDIEKVSGYF